MNLLTLFLVLLLSSPMVEGFLVLPSPSWASSTTTTTTQLHAVAPRNSLKPAALPLMDAGKAMARTGELLIEDVSNALDLYGGGLSAAGAQIRNAGDCLAQAAASMRFKTGLELVVDELREAGTCFSEAAVKCDLAVAEARQDEMTDLVAILGTWCVLDARSRRLVPCIRLNSAVIVRAYSKIMYDSFHCGRTNARTPGDHGSTAGSRRGRYLAATPRRRHWTRLVPSRRGLGRLVRLDPPTRRFGDISGSTTSLLCGENDRGGARIAGSPTISTQRQKLAQRWEVEDVCVD